MPLSRRDCESLDREDPLAGARALFDLPERLIYLDGNSLGALPRSVPPRMAEVVQAQWGRDLIGSWNAHGWIDLPFRIGAKVARLIGAAPDEVVAADSTSVNLFKLAAAAVRMRAPRRVIVAEAGDFPTDLYILQGLAELMAPGIELRIVPGGRAAGALDEDVALLLLNHVHYKSARIHDMRGLTAQAHAVGALTLWDLSHSAGVLDLQLERDRADFAVGCGYKYLNGGPGAPAFLFAARRHHEAMRLPLTGWMGHAEPFTFHDHYRPGAGVRQGLCGTPPILAMAALDEALDAFDGVSMADVRAKAMGLTDLFLRLVQERCPGAGLASASPLDPRERGGHVSLTHPDGYAIVRSLIERGVVGDFRAPDVLRFGFSPLYVSYADVWDAVERLLAVMAEGAWRDPRFQSRLAVT